MRKIIYIFLSNCAALLAMNFKWWSFFFSEYKSTCLFQETFHRGFKTCCVALEHLVIQHQDQWRVNDIQHSQYVKYALNSYMMHMLCVADSHVDTGVCLFHKSVSFFM